MVKFPVDSADSLPVAGALTVSAYRMTSPGTGLYSDWPDIWKSDTLPYPDLCRDIPG